MSKAGAGFLILAVACALPAEAQTYTVLHRFTGADGSSPEAGLISDAAGNLYGTTSFGGATNYGTVFRVDKTGLTVLYSFTGGVDGGRPAGGLIRDAAGNLYGTAYGGGIHDGGTVFKLDLAGKVTVLHSFAGKGGDGRVPVAGLTRDAADNLYGTCEFGGTGNSGTVFKLNQSGEKSLYSFKGGADGSVPVAGLLRDSAGNLYGTTEEGGAGRYGVIFKVDTAGAETVLHTFTGAGDGAAPLASPIQDPAGNFYGTTEDGGASNFGWGVVYKLDTSGAFTVLYSFTGEADGGEPFAGLAQDPEGNLYGTTFGGGTAEGLNGFGVVFKIDTTGRETVLHTFTGGTDGGNPAGILLRDAEGNLYGTTYAGGILSNATCTDGCGVVFKIAP